MSLPGTERRWRKRLQEIGCEGRKIRLPHRDELSQDNEWCEVELAGEPRRIRFHDYHEIYPVPGLYEQIFYDQLKCNSPYRVVRLLRDVLRDYKDDVADLRVLDMGAGNGMVADELRLHGCGTLVGIDIIEEAKDAAERDYPGLFADYHVADLTDLPEDIEKRIRSNGLNTLTCVAALGFGDIPTQAFLKALDLIETPGWLAFNIKEDFIDDGDRTGFCELIDELNKTRVIRIEALRRYPHRLSTTGKRLRYVGLIARKLKDVPDELMND